MVKITVIGSSNTDMIIKVPRIPRPGETILGGLFSTAAGGKGANQAVAASRAGGNVTFIARIGSDILGDQALKGFQNDLIDTKYVFRDTDAPSGTALIFVDETGENSIAVASGANAKLSPKDIENAKDAIISADILLMQLETPLETIMAAAWLASKNSVKVILNPAPAQQLPDALLRNIDILTPNENETELLTDIPIIDSDTAEHGARVLIDRGVKTVIVTLGKQGALLVTKDSKQLFPVPDVEVVDTTAAGDVFNGAFAVALAETGSIEQSIKFANIAATLSVTRLGAQPSAPARKQIDTFKAP
ncbi:ribokinase [candidate division KSB1 bacterium]|nr:ribokinase [candidate division KSB1 bacterium]